MITTCSKEYLDFPFCHRQPVHKGHCRFVHGHNWSFKFTFGCSKKDECGFVADFGKLASVKAWLTEMVDYTTVLNESDPALAYFQEDSIQNGEGPFGLYDLRVVPDCSCEGLAEFVFQEVTVLLAKEFGGRVFLQEVTVFEDSKNSATRAK
jgi:6-pyruvoyltetrahydropterin/6-carboxytetrahydropterin synthase